MADNRLFVKITHDVLPQVKDRYPFLYLERGRLEVDDSSVKWIDCNCNVVAIPIATISTILLGPGTSVTHEAIKVMSAANTMLCFVGEDSLLYYATGQSPTATTANIRRQAKLSSSKADCERIARNMFKERFPDIDISSMSLAQLRGAEGLRVKQLYCSLADKYKVGWKGRSYTPGKIELSDVTNKIITACNAALYGLCSSAITALGYSPHLGFVHTGSPLPFVYDIADLYKAEYSIELAFRLTYEYAGEYYKDKVLFAFRENVIAGDLLARISKDISKLMGDA